MFFAGYVDTALLIAAFIGLFRWARSLLPGPGAWLAELESSSISYIQAESSPPSSSSWSSAPSYRRLQMAPVDRRPPRRAPGALTPVTTSPATNAASRNFPHLCRYNGLGSRPTAMHLFSAPSSSPLPVPRSRTLVALLLSLASAVLPWLPPAHAQFGAPPTTRSTTPPPSSPPAGAASPSSSLKTWSAPTAPAPTRSSAKPPLSTTSPGSATTSPCPSIPGAPRPPSTPAGSTPRAKSSATTTATPSSPTSLHRDLDDLRAVHREVRPEPRHRPALRHRPPGQAPAEVKADYALGQRIGIEHTPTIWVTTANSHGRALR